MYLGCVLAALREASPQTVIAEASKAQGHFIVNSRVRVLVKYTGGSWPKPHRGPPWGAWRFDIKPADKTVLLNNITAEPSFLVLVCADYGVVAADAAQIIYLLDPANRPERQSLRGDKVDGGVLLRAKVHEPGVVLRSADFPRCLLMPGPARQSGKDALPADGSALARFARGAEPVAA